MGAQAVTGVAVGLLLRSSTLGAVGADWAPVVLVSALTLVLTTLAGLALARLAPVDPPTAALGMIAGGASGIVAMSGPLGADDRLVAVLQYLRVLVIVLLTPVLVPLAFGSGGGAGGALGAGAGAGGLGAELAVTAGAAGAGVLLGRAARLPAASLLGPLIVAGALTLAGPADGLAVPPALQDVAFALIGLQVGLRFTPAALRDAGALVLPALAMIGVLLVVSAGLGALLAGLAGVSAVDGYLATTPGGLYAVLATAVDTDADTTFVLAVQVLRLFVMLLAAPLVVRAIVRSA